ncbi:MAG: helix-turn-helix transcriptional regulator [Saprospiraceae bacterium]
MKALIQIIGSGATLMLFFLILSNVNKSNKKANSWLSIHVACIFLLFFDDTLTKENLYAQLPHLYGIFPIASLLLTPTLYLSTYHYIRPDRGWNKAQLIHFTLLIIYLICNAPFYFSSSETKLKYYYNDSMGQDGLLNVMMILFFIQAFVYVILMLQKIWNHQKQTYQYSAIGEKIQLNWLKNFIIVFFTLILCWFAETVFHEIWISEIFYLILLFGVFLLAYFSIWQQETFPINLREREEITDLIDQRQTNTAPIKSPPLITQYEMEDIATKLVEIMKTKKPFLDEELNISKMAGYVDTNAYKLSYTLNNHLRQTFSSYINDFRIVEAMKLLADPNMAHLNIIQIGYDCGFNSKTTFNTRFKKHTNYTPTEYRIQFTKN